MNVKSVEKKEKSTVELTIEVSAEEFNAAIEKVYKKQRGSINVPGFRKGHAPRKIIEGMYGAEVFYNDAINESYPAFYEQAMEQENLESVAYTDIKVTAMGKDGYTFTATTTVRPEVKLGEYKGLTVPAELVQVTDEDVENELKPFINRATRLVTVEREAKLGDTAVIDFEGFKDGVPFEGGKGEAFSLELGSGSFVPGFEDQIVGMKAGDEKDLDITFPEDYHEDLAGKAVVFHVKVHEVKEKEEPVVDDEFAKDVSEFDSLEAFKKSLADKVRERKESQAKRDYEDTAVRMAVENMEVEVPEAMIEYQAERLYNSYAQRITSQGIPFEQYLQMMGMTVDEMKEKSKESAVEVVRRELALHAVAEAEGLTVTDEELEEVYAELSKQYGAAVEEVKRYIPVEDVRKDQMDRKAVDVIVNSAVPGVPGEAKTDAAGEEKPKKKAAPKKKAEEGAGDGEEKPKRKSAPKKKAEEKTEE